MNSLLVDRDGVATRLAAEGSFALGVGETATAAQKYAEAGAALERNLSGSRKSDEIHLLRFLAATQYYHGGHYEKALKLASRIEARLLPNATRQLLPQFLKDVRERAAPGYVASTRQEFSRLWLAKEHGRLLNLLKNHPYVYDQGPLAFLRAVLCLELEQWQAAAAFYAMGLPTAQDGSDYMLMAVARVLSMPAEGRLDEAWAYISRLRELLPNAVTNLSASFVAFFRASRVSGVERNSLHREQLRFFDEGLSAFERMPTERQRHPEMRTITAICFAAASHAALRIGDVSLVRSVTERAIQFDPDAPGPLTARGMMNYPSPEALSDFQKAATLPHPGYAPFLYLAHHAFESGRLADAERLCREALARSPGRPVRAQLHGWLAIIRDCMGAPKEQVEELFKLAFEIDPCNGEVATNYRMFKEVSAPVPTREAKQWNMHLTRDTVEPDDITWEPDRASGPRRDTRVREVLLAGET